MLDNGDKGCIKYIGCYCHTWTKLQNPSHDLQAPLDLTRLIFRPRFFYRPHSPLLIRPFPRAWVLPSLKYSTCSSPSLFFLAMLHGLGGVFVPRPGIEHMPPVVGFQGSLSRVYFDLCSLLSHQSTNLTSF